MRYRAVAQLSGYPTSGIGFEWIGSGNHSLEIGATWALKEPMLETDRSGGNALEYHCVLAKFAIGTFEGS
jgi:hypothetical protein